jgi:integrase/recombinase XerD
MQTLVAVVELALMLGHSSTKITEKHYSPWVKVRHDQLTSVVMATWKAGLSA